MQALNSEKKNALSIKPAELSYLPAGELVDGCRVMLKNLMLERFLGKLGFMELVIFGTN